MSKAPKPRPFILSEYACGRQKSVINYNNNPLLFVEVESRPRVIMSKAPKPRPFILSEYACGRQKSVINKFDDVLTRTNGDAPWSRDGQHHS